MKPTRILVFGRMDVDRSRFLLLTASLAAVACNQPSAVIAPDTGGDDSSATKPGDGEPTGAKPASGVWLEIEPGAEDRPPQLADGDCDNTVGSPRTCGGLTAPPGHCESFDSTVQLCDAFPRFMQPRAAVAAVDCMLERSGSSGVCDWMIWEDCTRDGLEAACVDPRTFEPCTNIANFCGGGIDIASCQSAMSAVQPQHQNHLSTCIHEFCEISFCVTDLQWM